MIEKQMNWTNKTDRDIYFFFNDMLKSYIYFFRNCDGIRILWILIRYFVNIYEVIWVKYLLNFENLVNLKYY